MLTLATKTNQKLKRNNFLRSQLLSCERGFSIIEIMVALVVISIIFVLLPFSLTGTEREKLESALSKFNRAVRFCVDEAVLRNSIVRINLDLEAEPVEFSVEYGKGSSIVLPQSKDLSKLSIRERKREQAKSKKINNQFMKVDEFKDGNEPLPEGISIYAVGTTYYPKLVTSGNAYIYFYPTGERDSSLIILQSETELATFKVFPFEHRTEEEFILFSENELANLDYTLENKSKEIFEKWLKE